MKHYKYNKYTQIMQKSLITNKDNLHITFQESLKLISESFDRKETEALEIFLEKVVVKCVTPDPIPTLLKAIQTR